MSHLFDLHPLPSQVGGGHILLRAGLVLDSNFREPVA